jgi:hypothetical protein
MYATVARCVLNLKRRKVFVVAVAVVAHHYFIGGLLQGSSDESTHPIDIVQVSLHKTFQVALSCV